jgi:Short C-terminal domain/Bacterial PH domain
MTGMGIKRTVEVRVLEPPGAALAALREGAESAGMAVRDESESGFSAASKRSLLKNRWAAEIRVDLQPSADATIAAVTVDMAGTKHLSLVNELTGPLAGQIDDRGLNEAKERLGKPGRVFGMLELRALTYLLRGDERVIALGAGQFDGRTGMVCLTTARLLFVDKGLLTASLNQVEYPLPTIQAVSTKRSFTGETLVITSAGAISEITKLGHGQGEEITRQIHNLKRQPPPVSAPSAVSAEDPTEMLRKLASLRDEGIISEEEFAAKKRVILDRMV